MFDPLPLLTTRRLTLRTPVLADADRIARFAGDWDVARMTTRLPYPYGRTDAEAWLAICEAEGGAYAIEHDGELIGCCGYGSSSDEGTEIGYWLGRPWWGQGFATEAVGALVRHAFGPLGIRTLTAARFADNPASGRVLEKCGFRETGRRDCWSEARRAYGPAITYICQRPGLAQRARRWLEEKQS
jgi:RimJ/RimL family protein N-acetyltransferase